MTVFAETGFSSAFRGAFAKLSGYLVRGARTKRSISGTVRSRTYTGTPRATYSRTPPMCGHESDVVITALIGAPGNLDCAISKTLAEYPEDMGASKTTRPSSCL